MATDYATSVWESVRPLFRWIFCFQNPTYRALDVNFLFWNLDWLVSIGRIEDSRNFVIRILPATLQTTIIVNPCRQSSRFLSHEGIPFKGRFVLISDLATSVGWNFSSYPSTQYWVKTNQPAGRFSWLFQYYFSFVSWLLTVTYKNQENLFSGRQSIWLLSLVLTCLLSNSQLVRYQDSEVKPQNTYSNLHFH